MPGPFYLPRPCFGATNIPKSACGEAGVTGMQNVDIMLGLYNNKIKVNGV